jgi:hypothetical protein
VQSGGLHNQRIGFGSMRRAIALLPLVLLVAGGCGGDGDDSTEALTVTTPNETAKPLTNGDGGDSTEVVPGTTATTETTQPLTKAEYIEQADAICGSINPQSESLIEEVQRQLTNRDFEAAADTVGEAVGSLVPASSSWRRFRASRRRNRAESAG